MSASVKRSCAARMPIWQYVITSSEACTPRSLIELFDLRRASEGLRRRIERVFPIHRHRRLDEAGAFDAAGIPALDLSLRPRVHELHALPVDRALHLVCRRDLHGAGLHLERGARHRRHGRVHRELVGRPLDPATVEYRHVGVAVVIENPPQPRRVDAAALVVRDHARVGADAELGHQLLEFCRRRQKRRRPVGDANAEVIEPHRARDVAVVIRARAACRRCEWRGR